MRLRCAPEIEAASDLKWDALLLCIAGYILTSVGRVHQLFGFLEPLRPGILTGLVAILLFLFDPLPQRSARHLAVPTTRWLVALFVWMLLSLLFALNLGNAFEQVFDNFLKTVLMYVVVVSSVRGVRDVERLALTYVVGTAVYSAVVMSRFEVGSGAAWRLGHLYYYDANDFATLAVTAIPLALYVVLSAPRPLVRAAAARSIAVLIPGFLRSGSRGGFIAFVVMLAFLVMRYRGIPLRVRLAVAAAVAIAFLAFATDKYWDQMTTIGSDTDYNMTEESGRINIWRRGVGYMVDNPVFGVGPNNFPVAEGTLSPFAARARMGRGVRWNAAHNSYVQAGAELGIPGLLLFLTVIASTLLALRRTGRHGGGALSSALTASLLGFVVGAFFLSLAYSEMLYTLVALAIGLQKVTARPAQVPAVSR